MIFTIHGCLKNIASAIYLFDSIFMRLAQADDIKLSWADWADMASAAKVWLPLWAWAVCLGQIGQCRESMEP